MGPARIYPWGKMHRSRAPSIAPGTFFVAQSWAGYITNMSGLDLRQAKVLRPDVSMFPVLKVVTIVQPETLVSWHRAGFRRYWRWKSRRRGGRPRVEMEVRALIRLMSTENQLWGATHLRRTTQAWV